MTLLTSLCVMEQYGGVQPTALTGQVKGEVVKFGDGLFFEETTTNLVTNPSFETNVTGVTAGGTAVPTVAQSAVRAKVGTKSCLVTWVAGAASSGTALEQITVATGALAVQVEVYVPTGNPAVTLTATAGTATFTTTDASAATSTVKDQWQRLTLLLNITGAGTLNVGVTNAATTVAGQFAFMDCLGAEAKAYTTSWCSGELATLYNETGNLLPAAAQDFEDGSVGGYTTGTGTLANSSAQAYAGTKSLLWTLNATAAASVTSASGTAGVGVTVGKPYSAAMRVRPSAARQLRLDIVWYTAAGAAISTSSATAVTGVANQWNQLNLTAFAPATAAFAAVQMTSSDATNADTYNFDAIRLSEGSDAATFRWTGQEHASTSTRVAATLSVPLAATVNSVSDLSFVVVAKVGAPQVNSRILGGPRQDINNLIYLQLSSAGAVSCNTVKASTATAGPSVALACAAGDIITVGLSLTAAGVLTVYASKNGGAVLSAALTNAAYNGIPLTAADIGYSLSGGIQAICALEQYLIYNRAISATEFATLAAATAEVALKDDPSLIFAAAAGIVRGTYTGATTAGTGSYRLKQRVTGASVIPVLINHADPGDNQSTVRVSLTANSGIGQGTRVSFDDVGRGPFYTVNEVFSGTQDELYLQAV